MILTALTLWPEWLPTITHMGKDVQNRSWPAPARIIGTRIALHAGKSIGGGKKRDGIVWVGRTAWAAGWRVRVDYLDLSSMLVRQREAGDLLDDPGEWFERVPIHLGAIVATAKIVETLKGHDSAWAIEGQWQWVLEDVRMLPTPIPMRGRQGLWKCELTAEQLGNAA